MKRSVSSSTCLKKERGNIFQAIFFHSHLFLQINFHLVIYQTYYMVTYWEIAVNKLFEIEYHWLMEISAGHHFSSKCLKVVLKHTETI